MYIHVHGVVRLQECTTIIQLVVEQYLYAHFLKQYLIPETYNFAHVIP